MSRHQLLGAEVSYYTGKVRAYLRYKDIPFTERAASRDVYKNIILPRTGVRMIPVFITDDDIAIQDSTDIIDFLEARYPESPVYPLGPVQKLLALLLEVYGDEWLVIPAMHYRWSFEENRRFAMAEFGRLSAPDESPEAQLSLGERLAEPFAGALPYLGVSKATIPGIEASYLAFLQDFSRHLAEHPFLLGSRPSIADFSFYGSLYAHLYRDPYSGRLMREKAPAVADWVERMREPVPRSGEFLDGDQLPATLESILQRMFQEQGPVLSNTIDAVTQWVSTHGNDEPLRRSIGMQSFTVGGCEGQKSINPYHLWMWQRAYDHYQSLPTESRSQADELLRRVGGYELFQKSIPQRVTRKENHLVLA